jgi:hypothetical protein
MSEFKIFPECYADTLLVEKLFLDLKRSISHKYGTEVARDMELFPTEKIIGLVDKDKKMHTYFLGFQVIETHANEHLHWWKHPEHEHHIIILEKDIKRWLYHAASTVKPVEFGLPAALSDRPTLKQFKKAHTTKLTPQFCNFVEAVCKQDTELILTVKRWMQVITQP